MSILFQKIRGSHILKKSLKLQDKGLNSSIFIKKSDSCHYIKKVMEKNNLSYIKMECDRGSGRYLIGYKEVRDFCEMQDWLIEQDEELLLEITKEK